MTWLTLNVFNLRFPCRINQLVSGYECDMTFISDDTPTVNHTRREGHRIKLEYFLSELRTSQEQDCTLLREKKETAPEKMIVALL